MIICKLDETKLDDIECGGSEVGKKEHFKVKFFVNDPAGSIALESFLPGATVNWAFWHDEVHVVLGGEAEVEYTLPPNHRKVCQARIGKGQAYLILAGTRTKFKIISREPYLHACVIMPRFHYEKRLLKEEY